MALPEVHSTSSRRLRSYALTVYWVALFIGTHIPLPQMALPGHSDKSMHFVAYAGLSFLFTWWLHGTKHATLKTVGVLGVYAVVDEVLQYPVNRTPDVLDAVADWVGIIIGLIIFHTLRRCRILR